ncbi:MAG: type I restriction endonuclease subunit R [Elusimicrobia bacterium]|nr:type I restriction endonuclease subunit R [Elusimicrobiota bacterium]
MSPNPYNEDQLVEQPAIKLFASLGWQTVSAMEEVYGPGGTLGRETPGEVVLLPRLRAALTKLNPTMPPEALDSAITDLTRDRATMSLVAANQEVYDLLKAGVKVSIPDPSGRGGQKDERVRVIDWENPAANDFLLVSQFTVTGSLYTCRPDLVGFVNGLPVVVIELKKPGVPAKQAFDENLTSYKHDQNGIPQLFWSNALIIASNGTDSRVGSLTADWDRFFEWKRVEREDEPRRVSLEVMIRGVADKTRLLDLMENFTLFSQHKLGLVKVLSQNHQFLGVNNTLTAMQAARKAGHGRGGVFWQTQGSGKSFSMVFFSQKVLRKLPGDWTFVVVTDRVELDEQIAKTFKATGAVSDKESKACHAESGEHLRKLLRGNHRYVFTLIHKFQTPEMLCDRRDVIVLTDESHRSQYDTLAVNMRAALPNAVFIAFTGTPLIAGEERTREVFGDYVSIYDFQQSVDDGATKPLYYENRTPELRLENPDLNDDVYAVIEAAELDADQERQLDRELGRQYHIITRDQRLETIAKDIVQHFLGRGFMGKAMVVSIDKATALKMHAKVRRHWQTERASVEKELAGLRIAKDLDREREVRQRLGILKSTDMALVVSPGQNEIEQMKKLGLDIASHRKRMVKEKLDEKFKDSNDPLRLVFVCAMWMTGFDVESCSTIYLDKPMRNHTLMQTIARANRVFPGKPCGLIVDYANVFASLEKALAIYGKGTGGETPVRDKQRLVEDLRKALAAATAFCASHKVDIAAIEALPMGNLDRLARIADAVDCLIAPDPLRKDFLAHEKLVATLFKAIKPDPAVLEFFTRVTCLAMIAATIRERTGEGGAADVSEVMAEINTLLDESIAADGFRISDPVGKDGKRPGTIDLSKIDFEALAKKFPKSQRKNIELEQLKAAIRAQLEKLIRLNKTRTDYSAKFEALIESYNAGSRNIDELFKELLSLSRALTKEENRHVRENLEEEELTVFDILTRPGPDLSPQERDEVKKVTKHLLTKVKAVLVLNWRQKAQARAKVQLAIEDALDEGLPRSYAKDLYKRKVAAVFEHVYESYRGEGASVFNQPHVH